MDFVMGDSHLIRSGSFVATRRLAENTLFRGLKPTATFLDRYAVL